jgi:hypothetical protein
MPTIVDPDDLRLSSASAGNNPNGEVFIDTTNLTIQLNSITEFSNSSNFTAAEGVTLQALYSFLKEQWKNNDVDDFYRYRFPMEAITAEQFEFINGWTPKDDTTRSYIRTAGWAEKNTAGVEQRAYMGVITLGNIEADQTAYYGWYSSASSEFVVGPTDFTFNGPVNEAVQIYENSLSAAANFDYRTNYNLFTFIRPTPKGNSSSAGGVTGYTYDISSTDAIGTRDAVANQVYRFPLATAVDTKITLNDSEASASATSVGYRLRFDQASLSSTQLPVQLDGGTFNFTHLIDSTNGDVQGLTPQQVYDITQYKLRLNADIDDEAGASRNGKLTEELVRFVGDQLQTKAISDIPLSTSTDNEGVLIDNFGTGVTANLAFTDDTNTLRLFPAISSGDLIFSPTLKDDPSTRYWMFYTSASSGQSVWPGATAKIVKDNDGVEITGYYHVRGTPVIDGNTSGVVSASGASVISFTGDTLTPNSQSSNILRITSGNNVGFYTIADNAASSITVSGLGFENPETAATFSVYTKNTGNVAYTFDYTGNNTREDGLTAQNADITIVALGLDNAQYVTATGEIGNGAGQNFSITAPLERNYNDPL